MTNHSIAIIGAGFSGTLLSLSLQASAPPDTRIHLIESTGRFGPGLAYSTANRNHLLNVPAGRMSAFPGEPLDFLHWLQARASSGVNEAGFTSRATYGAYLSDRLARGLRDRSSATIEPRHDTVVALASHGRGVTLQLASGQRIEACAAILAMGNFPPLPPMDATALAAAGLWRGEAWSAGSLAGLDLGAAVLLIGTGLTMVDAVIALLDAGHHGPIHALSRRGLLPASHLDRPAPKTNLPQLLPRDLTRLVRLVRQEIARALAAGEPWQGTIDALRPATQGLWQGFQPAERRRFLRHLRGWWDVHRHRMPPQVADRIALARRNRQLHIHAARIVAATVVGGAAEITWQPRGRPGMQVLHAARVVNCTGPAGDITRVGDRFVQALLRDGIVRADPLRLGFDVTGSGATVDRWGHASERIFAVGPLTKGRWWEITAVPDIRQQCQELARRLAAMLVKGSAQAHGAATLFASDPAI